MLLFPATRGDLSGRRTSAAVKLMAPSTSANGYALATHRYYLSHPEEHAKVARAGLLHALTYHRAVSRIDYVLRSAHEEQEHDAGRHSPAHYGDTGGSLLQSHPEGEKEIAAG